jgi:hypothetical protein
MAGNRTLKLSILGDVDDLKKKLGQGADDVDGFAGKLTKFGKVAGLAFAAAGAAAVAYAGKLAIDGVKSALEDEAAQAKLALTLKNVAGATDEAIERTEMWITNMGIAFGVSDEDLRPSIERLTRATGSLEEAQRLSTLALDISAGSGKSLEAVSNALGKAYEGNTMSLGKLGIGLEKVELKSMTLDEITAHLADTFGGQAAAKADTFAGKMERLKLGISEAQESIGSLILTALTPLVENITTTVLPVLRDFINGFSGNDGLKLAFIDIVNTVKSFVVPIFQGLKSAFDSVSKAVMDNKESFAALLDFAKILAPFFAGALKIAITGIGKALAVIVNVVAEIIDGFRLLISVGSKVGNFLGNLNPFGGGKAAGGPVSMGKTYLVGEKGPELFSPSSNGSIVPNHKLTAGGGGGTTINISVSGAIDPASTARQIANLLKNEASTSGSFINLGQSVFA